MVTSIVITFSELVTLTTPATNAFELERTAAVGSEQPGQTGLVNILATQSSPNVVPITFLMSGPSPINGVSNSSNPSLPDGIYSLTIFGAQVSGQLGTLDADYDGIASPTENFVMEGEQANDLFRLFGDGDGNGTVNSDDLARLRLCMFTTQGMPWYIFAFDYMGDEQIGSDDFARFQERVGLNLFP